MYEKTKPEVLIEIEKRGFFKLNLVSLTFTILAILFVLVAIGAMSRSDRSGFLGTGRRDRDVGQDRTLAGSVHSRDLGARGPLPLWTEP